MNTKVGLSNNSEGIIREIIKGVENSKTKIKDQDILLVEFDGQTGNQGLPNGKGKNNIIPIIKFKEYKKIGTMKLTRSN